MTGRATKNRELTFTRHEDLELRRVKRGRGFAYLCPSGKPLLDPAARRRIQRLAIPPAWTSVKIARKANAHLQAIGRDARGRLQYKYHPRFVEIRDRAKFEHLLEFGGCLARLRKAIDRDMQRRGLGWHKVVATVVHLLDMTLIRVGNTEYAQQNGSYGLTTLRDRHVDIVGRTLRFEFTGKGGKVWRLKIGDRRAARIVKSCQDIPGQHLFQFLDDGERRSVSSGDVNSYLRDVTGKDVSAKDFRTWGGTVLTADALKQLGQADTVVEAKRNIRFAVGLVARRLGNTATICRKCYIHPDVLSGYLEGTLIADLDAVARKASETRGLQSHEAAVLSFLRMRKSRRQEDRLRSPAAVPGTAPP